MPPSGMHIAALAGVDDINLREPVLGAREEVSPQVFLGCSVHQALDDETSIPLEKVLSIYQRENYVLLWNRGVGKVVLKDSCHPSDKIKALWQVRGL